MDFKADFKNIDLILSFIRKRHSTSSSIFHEKKVVSSKEEALNQ